MRLDDVGGCPQKPHLSAPVVSQQAGSRNEGGGYVDGVSSPIHHSLRVHSRSLRKERGRLSGRKGERGSWSSQVSWPSSPCGAHRRNGHSLRRWRMSSDLHGCMRG